MKIKEKCAPILKRIKAKFHSQFGFEVENTNVSNIMEYMYRPVDSSSLAVTRILFGFLMLIDAIEERGGSTMDKRWGDPLVCHFPLFPFLKPVPMPYMAFVYAALWLGALGIMLGYKYHATSSMFTVTYWYLYLLEKSYWNNHSYLFGLVAILLTFTDANCYWSIDALQDPSKRKTSVPYWNYFILKYQFFILYFMAGLKKGTAEWLTGYSVPSLSQHWVFAPFKLFLSNSQIDYLVVHWFVFIFDLTISMWMMYSKSRHVAVFFCCLFHLMNVRLFAIGMFPWVCLATLPLFYPFDWPKTLFNNCQWGHKINTLITNLNETFSKMDQLVTFDEDLDTTIFNDNQKQITNSENNQENEKANLGNNDDDDHEVKALKDKAESKLDEIEKIQTVENSSFGEIGDEYHEVEENAGQIIEKSFLGDNDDFNHEDKYFEFNDDEEVKLIENKMESKEVENFLGVQRLIYEDMLERNENKSSKSKKKCTLCFILFYVLTQAFLPYSHFITKVFGTIFALASLPRENTGEYICKESERGDYPLNTQGYNNWTDGLYGYSWDMMVHTWDTSIAYITIKDNNSNHTYITDAHFLTLNDRWTRHGDMAHQYAKCLKKVFVLFDQSKIKKNMPANKEKDQKKGFIKGNLLNIKNKRLDDHSNKFVSNISIYADVWCSMNGRFTQRLYDKRVDLLQVEWSPFKKNSFVLPLLDDARDWRVKIDEIRKHVFSWSNHSDVIFKADFPGYQQSKYVGMELTNVSLTVLKGVVAYELQHVKGFSQELYTGEKITVNRGYIHNIHILSDTPAFYMYTFNNVTQPTIPSLSSKPAILKEILIRFQRLFDFGCIMWKSIVESIFELSQIVKPLLF